MQSFVVPAVKAGTGKSKSRLVVKLWLIKSLRIAHSRSEVTLAAGSVPLRKWANSTTPDDRYFRVKGPAALHNPSLNTLCPRKIAVDMGLPGYYERQCNELV